MTKYPTLDAAMMMFCNDQGLKCNAVKLDSVNFDNETVVVDRDRVEVVLHGLSPTELVTLCVGDLDDMEPIYAKMSAEDREMVHVALDAMFMATGGCELT